jgi:hypothetical protein
MDASAGFCGGHSLNAVHPALIFQLAVRAPAFDRRDHFLQSAHAGVAARHHFDAPSLAFGVLAVHPEQLAGKERRLVAAGAGADFEDDLLASDLWG